MYDANKLMNIFGAAMSTIVVFGIGILIAYTLSYDNRDACLSFDVAPICKLEK